jgi:RNA polymerase sigma factor (sigma-70 family)
LLAEEMRLDPLRLAEAQLMATEAVGLFVDSGRTSLEIKIEAGPADWRVELGSDDDPPTPELDPLSTRLFGALSKHWGDERSSGRRLIWFHVRAPGTGAVLAEVDSTDLLARAPSDPLYQEEVVRRFGPFSASIARRFRGKGVADVDLEQVALLGLVAAMHRFDVDKGDFEPFAAVTIAGELKRHLRDRAWSVRVPRALQESTLNVGKASDRLTQQFGRQPTASEVALELGMTTEEVLEAQKARVAYRWESIDATDPVTGGSAADSLSSEEDGVMSSQMHVSRLLARALERLRSVVQEESDA